MNNIDIGLGKARTSAAESAGLGTFPPAPISQIDDLLSQHHIQIDELEAAVVKLGKVFGPVLNEQLCAKAGSEHAPEPCLSPLGNQLRSYNGRLEQINSAISSLIGRSAL